MSGNHVALDLPWHSWLMLACVLWILFALTVTIPEFPFLPSSTSSIIFLVSVPNLWVHWGQRPGPVYQCVSWSLAQDFSVEWVNEWMNHLCWQINIIMIQSKTEENMGHHGSKKVKADWGWQGEETQESFPLPWGGVRHRGHVVAHYKKNISFLQSLDFYASLKSQLCMC